MGKITRRGALAASAAVAVALSGAVGASAADDSAPIDIDGTVDVDVELSYLNIWRFADKDRIGTAINAAERTNVFDESDTVIIANTREFSDALAAAPLADELDAPVLLDNPGNAPTNQVAEYLQNEGISNVILASGPSIFTEAYVGALESAGISVERYAGVNRYETAIALADAAIDEGYDFENVFLASGTDFADALAAGAAAANYSGVVLLTKGSEGIDNLTFGALTGAAHAPAEIQNHRELIAVGGPAAAAAEVGNGLNPVEVDTEIIGADRYETAVLAAETYFGNPENFVIASGEDFPDAVVAGSYAANVDGPLLLVQNDNLVNVTADYVYENADRGENIMVFGGVNSIARSVSLELADLFTF